MTSPVTHRRAQDFTMERVHMKWIGNFLKRGRARRPEGLSPPVEFRGKAPVGALWDAEKCKNLCNFFVFLYKLCDLIS